MIDEISRKTIQKSQMEHASQSELERMSTILKLLLQRFEGYRKMCSENEAIASSKNRHDLALSYQCHESCWSKAESDVRLALTAFFSGQPIESDSPPQNEKLP